VHDFGWLAGDPGARMTAHQTVSGFFGHLLVFEPICSPSPVADLPRLAAALTALVTAGAFFVTARLQRLDGELPERALTLGLFVALMVPVAPRAEGYHHVLVFPALAIAAWWAVRAPAGRAAWLALIGCAALLCVPRSIYQSPGLARGWLALLAYPRVAGAFGLWVWLGRALRRVPSAP
jgi:hypothetical protein